jgi:dTMP kinase
LIQERDQALAKVMSLGEEIARLGEEKEEEVMRLRKEKEEEVMRLEKEKEEEVMRLRKEKGEEVMRLEREKEEEVMRLKGELDGVRGERDAKVVSLRAASDHVDAARAESDLLRKQVASLERAAADLEERGRREVASLERECERKLSVLERDLERAETKLKVAEDEGGRKREGLEGKVGPPIQLKIPRLLAFFPKPKTWSACCSFLH